MELRTMMASLAASGEGQGQYRKTNRFDIISILRILQSQHDPVSVFIDQGDELLQSGVVRVEAENDTFYFADTNPEGPINIEGAAAFVAAPGGVLVEFAADDVRHTRLGGLPAYMASIPPVIFKLHRREDHRACAPIINPYFLHIRLAQGRMLHLVVHDMAEHGVACRVCASDVMHFHVGMMHHGILELGSALVLKVMFRITSIREISYYEPLEGNLLGMSFEGMNADTRRKIAQVLHQLEETQHNLFG